jgi:hypothetical protein
LFFFGVLADAAQFSRPSCSFYTPWSVAIAAAGDQYADPGHETFFTVYEFTVRVATRSAIAEHVKEMT